jgi:NAD(P)H-dependent FMN reductase
MIHASRTLVIVGSTRARRIAPAVAAWVARLGGDGTEIADLEDWPLPMDDEPGIPAVHDYDQAHTRAWSRKVSDAQAFVFVAPQYNWGYPAALKNALDHLYREWHGKPAMIVSYGHRGGGKCAAQLRQVLRGLHMRTVASARLKLSKDRIKANTGEIDAASVFARHADEIRRGFAKLESARRGPWWRRLMRSRAGDALTARTSRSI